MKRVFESKKLCVTMFFLMVLSVLANSFAGGSLPTFGNSPVLVPSVQQEQRADGPFFPPPGDDSTSPSLS
jgi:hypothetical protein